MVAIRTKFDGTNIQVPSELKNGEPGEVIVIVADSMIPEHGATPRQSIWDVIAKANGTRTGEDIDRQVREERESWNVR